MATKKKASKKARASKAKSKTLTKKKSSSKAKKKSAKVSSRSGKKAKKVAKSSQAKSKSKSKSKVKTKAKAKKKTSKAVKSSAKKTAAKKTTAKKASVKKSSVGKATAKKVSAKPTRKPAASKKNSKSGGRDPFAALLPAEKKSTQVSQHKWSELFSPLDDRVLVVPDRAEETTQGGLYIPQMAQDGPQKGVVASLGPGSKDPKGRRRPLDVHIGDRVLFRTYAGQRFQLFQEDLLILREDEILGVVPD